MPSFFRVPCLLAALCFALSYESAAHNGKIAQAYPLANITVDGNLSDWPKNAVKYPLAANTSDTKHKDKADFSGFFQVGYRLGNRSFYVAVTITDDSFLEDTSESVAWNTQDGLELNIDARHLQTNSGVTSFMYSKKLRTINKSEFDNFSKTASWDMAEAVMVRRGNTRYYEWRINMGDELQPWKSIGLDFQCFDKDTDGSFTYTSWGNGAYKFRDPKSLGDVFLLPAENEPGIVSGKVIWDRSTKVQLSRNLRVISTRHPQAWTVAEFDSSGEYSVHLPAGEYRVMYPHHYYGDGKNLFSVSGDNPVRVHIQPAGKLKLRDMNLRVVPAPDLIPEKGVLHTFGEGTESKIDSFIETYRRYYDIPGVSLAVIKDGKVAYHKTYGVRNTVTNDKVEPTSLFEAASITKPVFAYAVQRLSDRGVIDLDKPLYQYLPYKDIEYDERYKLITARHVLTHRTGFPNWRWMNPDNKLDLKFTPGIKYQYSGEGFEYLKKVVEKITGKKVETVLHEEVIEPMQLYHTFFSKNDSLAAMKTNGHYDLQPTPVEMPDEPGMAYSMHTEAKVFSNFMLHLMEQKGLKPETYKSMLSKHSDYEIEPGDELPPYPVYMGMSLEVKETPMGISFGHGGNNGNFKCRFEVFKDIKMGYAIFTNSNTSDVLLYSALGDFLIEGKRKEKK